MSKTMNWPFHLPYIIHSILSVFCQYLVKSECLSISPCSNFNDPEIIYNLLSILLERIFPYPINSIFSSIFCIMKCCEGKQRFTITSAPSAPSPPWIPGLIYITIILCWRLFFSMAYFFSTFIAMDDNSTCHYHFRVVGECNFQWVNHKIPSMQMLKVLWMEM